MEELIVNTHVPVSLAQFVRTCINICRGWGSNPGHATYSPWKMRILATKLLDKKEIVNTHKQMGYSTQAPFSLVRFWALMSIMTGNNSSLVPRTIHTRVFHNSTRHNFSFQYLSLLSCWLADFSVKMFTSTIFSVLWQNFAYLFG